MKTIIFSAIGIVVLVAISFFVNALEIMKNNKAAEHLANIRKALARKSEWLMNTKKELFPSAFRRTNLRRKVS